MDEKGGQNRRRKAMRSWLNQIKRGEILKRVNWSRSWFKKWKKRFEEEGWQGLKSQSRAPQHRARAYAEHVRQRVVQARYRLARRKVGLSGAKAIQRELAECALPATEIPSRATGNRMLAASGVTGDHPPVEPYFPQPRAAGKYEVQQMDWTARYLEGGQRVFAFHTISLTTRAMHQTIATDKSTQTVRRHLLESGQSGGVPEGLQLDTDAAFCGGYTGPRVVGACVRLCLYMGVEPIFTPVREAQRNGVVERLNGLWAQSFWNRTHFRSVGHVRRAQPRFRRWYATTYLPAPPSPARARRYLTEEDLAAGSDPLPITAGRVHFLRRVEADGTISLLNARWRVGRCWAGQYVWATIITHEHRLRLYYRAPARATARLLKESKYELHEPVRPLNARFVRTTPRRKMDTML